MKCQARKKRWTTQILWKVSPKQYLHVFDMIFLDLCILPSAMGPFSENFAKQNPGSESSIWKLGSFWYVMSTCFFSETYLRAKKMYIHWISSVFSISSKKIWKKKLFHLERSALNPCIICPVKNPRFHTLPDSPASHWTAHSTDSMPGGFNPGDPRQEAFQKGPFQKETTRLPTTFFSGDIFSFWGSESNIIWYM